MNRSSLAVALWGAVVAAGVGMGSGRADDADIKLLLSGVNEIAAPGLPGTLCIWGEKAFPVVVGSAGRDALEPVVAAARMGKGRIVAFGHDGYFGKGALETADTGRLMVNAVRWAAGGKEKPKVAVHKQPGLLAYLQQSGLRAEPLNDADWHEKLSSFDVLCIHPTAISTPAKSAAVAKFIRAGGGLIAGDTGWGWLQLHPGKTLTEDHPGNRLLVPAGLAWADGSLKRTADAGFAASEAPPKLAHAARALDAMEAHARGEAPLDKKDLAQAAWVITHAARSLPPSDDALLPRLRRLREQHAAEAIPKPDKPLTTAEPLARLALTLQLQELKRTPPEKVRAHPAAEFFPGAVPADAERVTRSIEVDTAVPGRHSTGLYAAPGELIEVRIPEDAVGKGLSVRIGAHSDSLWGKDSWKRAPDICNVRPLSGPVTRTANAFGGPIYIEVPKGCKLGAVSVEIGGAVEAPYYVLGKTRVDEWRSTIRNRPAPWAELENSKVILTVPSKVVRNLDDAQALMRFWARVLDCCAELAQRPLERERPERYVTDVQISAGYMHSGYPIMTLTDVAKVMVDKDAIISNAHGGVWGLFHEMGHNHQSGDWTFGGTGEVTVNLFSMYVLENACGRATDTHPAISPENRAKKMKKYFASGANFDDWKRDPFLALIMYIQLKDAFGWDAYKRVFAEYRDLPKDQRPKNDDEKRDQWMVRFSRTVGRNLGPFFQAWGIPTSEKARAEIANLPAWMPEGFPPK